jgi:integrating conjugative element protein (TIGR03758 family)
MLRRAAIAALPPVVVAGPASAFDAAAFAAGAGYPADSYFDLFVLIIGVLALVWIVWLALGAYQQWAAGQESALGMLSLTLRGCLVAAVIGAFLR